MTHEFTDPREKAQYLPTLDPDIKEFIEADIDQGFSNLASFNTLRDFIKGKFPNPDAGQIADQLVSAVVFIDAKANKQLGLQPGQYDHNTGRLLALTDSFADYPDELAAFLADPRVGESRSFTSPDFLAVVPSRHRYANGELISVLQLACFGYIHSEGKVKEGLFDEIIRTLEQLRQQPDKEADAVIPEAVSEEMHRRTHGYEVLLPNGETVFMTAKDFRELNTSRTASVWGWDEEKREATAEAAEVLIGHNTAVELAENGGLIGLKVSIKGGRIGITYDTLEDLKEDLRKYFVYGVADLPRLLSVDGIPHAIERYERTEAEVLEQDFMAPLRDFVNMGPDYRYKAAQARGRYITLQNEDEVNVFFPEGFEYIYSPYKYSNRFDDYSITVYVDGTGNDAVFTLMIGEHGSYDRKDDHERLLDFAAAVNKPIKYPEESIFKIAPRFGGCHTLLDLFARGDQGAIDQLGLDITKEDQEGGYTEYIICGYKNPNASLVQALEGIGVSVPPNIANRPEAIIKITVGPIGSSYHNPKRRSTYLEVSGLKKLTLKGLTPDQAAKILALGTLVEQEHKKSSDS